MFSSEFFSSSTLPARSCSWDAFSPNTAVSGLDISMKSPEEVGVILDDAVGDYKLVDGAGSKLLAERGQIGMTLDSTAISEG